MICRKTSSGMLGTHKSGAIRSNGCSCQGGASLKTSFATPFLRSKNAEGLVNVSRCRNNEKVFSISFREYFLEFCGQDSPKWSTSSSNSSDLDWRTVIMVLELKNGPSTA